MRADSARVTSIAKHARQTLKSSFGSPETMTSAFGGGFWVAIETAGELIGCVGLSAACVICCLAVLPRARRQGVASALLEAAEAACPDETVLLETLGSMHGAIALYEKHGYELVATRTVPAKAGAFELQTYRKKLKKGARSEARDLEAVPLIEDDKSEPALTIAYVAPLQTHVIFPLPSPLYPRIGIVFRLGGRRYLARRNTGRTSTETQRTLLAGTLVRCELKADAQPAWAFARRINTFRNRQPFSPVGECKDEGPCTCNAECVVG